LLSLPVGIEQYEQGLKVSGQPESLWYGWSITEPLQALESGLREMAALGEWEELILQELVDGFHCLVEMLRRDSPKAELLLLMSLFRSMELQGRNPVDAVLRLAQAPLAGKPIVLPLDPDRSNQLAA